MGFPCSIVSGDETLSMETRTFKFWIQFVPDFTGLLRALRALELGL